MKQQIQIGFLLVLALILTIFLVPIASLFYPITLLSPIVWRSIVAVLAVLLLVVALILGYRQKFDRHYVLYYVALLLMLALTSRLIYSVFLSI
ncbi:hypothetical protein [Kurthia senegalensis]|uniref:hypothetical protein n=1 Tax=Kurthia senegalensis TaxID=1033740 RepID=UPI000287D506|nr:hypothetical protein [Kurthia senegalensis]